MLVVDFMIPFSSLSSLTRRKNANNSRMRRVLADGGTSNVAREGCSKSVFSSYLPNQSSSAQLDELTQVIDVVDSVRGETAEDRRG